MEDPHRAKKGSAPLLFLLETGIAQAIATSLMVVAWKAFPSLPLVLCLGTLTAGLYVLWLGLPLPWQVVNLLIIPASAYSLSAELPAWLPLLLFLAALVVYAPAFWTRVPYYPTHRAAYALILAELPRDKPFTFIDIGCGFGDLLFFLSRHRPNGSFYGIEIGLLPYLVGFFRTILQPRSRVTIELKSMWSLNLSQFDTVYTFLSPAPMPRLWEKVRAEMRPGSLFITNSFPVPSQASRVMEVKDDRQGVLYCHQI